MTFEVVSIINQNINIDSLNAFIVNNYIIKIVCLVQFEIFSVYSHGARCCEFCNDYYR